MRGPSCWLLLAGAAGARISDGPGSLDCLAGTHLEVGAVVHVVQDDGEAEGFEAIVEGCGKTDSGDPCIFGRSDTDRPGCWQASALRRNCARLEPETVELPPDTAELIFVRHSTSLNNVFRECTWGNTWSVVKHWARDLVRNTSEDFHWSPHDLCNFKSGYERVCHKQGLCGSYAPGAKSSLAWEIGRSSQDCLLHPDSEESSVDLGRILAGVLPEEEPIHSFYTSPLRRTVQTLLGTGSPLFSRSPSATVGVSPWAHERYKSKSDLAQDGKLTAAMTERYAEFLGDKLDEAGRRVSETLRRELEDLGDWSPTLGAADPPLKVQSVRADGESGETFPFYPSGTLSRVEPDDKFDERMTILRRWLKKLPPGRRHMLFSHGGVGKRLFAKSAPWKGAGLANLAVLVARFKPAEADAEDADGFFTEVATARDKWTCDALPGWRLTGASSTVSIKHLIVLGLLVASTAHALTV